MNFIDMFFKITFAFVDLVTNMTSETGLRSSCEFLWHEFCFDQKSQSEQAYQVIFMNFIYMFFKITFTFTDLITNLTSETGP